MIVDEFSKRAIYFAQLSGLAVATQRIINTTGISADADVLDMACGAASIACEAHNLKHLLRRQDRYDRP